MIDWLIVSFMALGSVKNKSNMILLGCFLINIYLIELINYSNTEYYWQSLALWALIFSIKDFLFMALLSIAKAPISIILSIGASCIFHQVLRWQILTYNWENLTLMNYRSELMMYLSLIIITTMIFEIIGGGGNGGKRVKSDLFSSNFRVNNLFHLSTREAIK